MMKKGSALLIVLGMVAFMVVSAVAFSAYMRHARLPSSYLRRTSSSRHLVKAALAEAIDILDASIGNDAFPGAGDSGSAWAYPRMSTTEQASLSAKRNYWRRHCFIGTNQLARAEETVSTLTLEGLAYLPPALINEARYYSRLSTAARWHNFAFDSGRFAFSAFDVSDHIDINRVTAGTGRNSADCGKISLAHVFENAAHTSDGTPSPTAWDAFMDQFVDAKDAYKYGGSTKGPNGAGNPSKVPLVSLADFNLAVNRKGWSPTMSPFCQYVENNIEFVTAVGETDSRASITRLMTFVTDSYFPKASAANADDDYDLNDARHQPFRASDLRTPVANCYAPIVYSGDDPQNIVRLYESVCGLGLCALWDYLDDDNLPISLAIPTTERVPMIAAIKPTLAGGQLQVTKANIYSGQPDGVQIVATPTPATRTVLRTYQYKLDPTKFSQALMAGKVQALVTFPFRRDEDANDTFKVGGRVELFFGDQDMKFHTGNAQDVLHFSRNPTLNNFAVQDGVFYLPLTEQSVSFSGVAKEEDAVKEVSFPLSAHASALASWLQANSMFEVSYQWTQTQTPSLIPGVPPTWAPANETDPGAAPTLVNPTACYIPPLKADGIPNGTYVNAPDFLNLVQNGGGADVSLKMCVWLYVKNSQGKYVDLVPASMKDDDDLNSGRSFQLMGPDGNQIGGTPHPLMRFAGAGFKYEPLALESTLNGVDFGLGPAAVMCADPRWNWAPEHWFEMTGGFTPQGWLNACQRGQDGRDRDIFMATSDAGYLQSIYELAFIPRLTDLRGFGSNKIRGDMQTPEDGRTAFAANFNDTRNKDFAWRTYRPFPLANGQDADPFWEVGFTSEGTGFRVNPYAESSSVMMAALANTPYNWMVAATNTVGANAIQEAERTSDKFNKRYCFNLMGPVESKFAWDDLSEIAKNLVSAMRSRTDGDWEAGFRSLDWAGLNNAGDFAGVTLSDSTCDLYDVDRKFLYGYWHDCFAAKQQLFLVFVRAEPQMMGGGAVGQTPPQLGARAVALVWRDPRKTPTDVGNGQPRPHRTRVLFYRQFD